MPFSWVCLGTYIFKLISTLRQCITWIRWPWKVPTDLTLVSLVPRSPQPEPAADHCAQGAWTPAVRRQLPAVRDDVRELPETARLLHQGDHGREAATGCDRGTALVPPLLNFAIPHNAKRGGEVIVETPFSPCGWSHFPTPLWLGEVYVWAILRMQRLSDCAQCHSLALSSVFLQDHFPPK